MRERFKFLGVRLVILAALLLVTIGAPLAQSRGTEAIQELKFSRRLRVAVVSGSVQLPHGAGDMHNDGTDRYSLHYRAGQSLTFDLQSEGKRAVLSVFRMDGSSDGLPSLVTKWSGKLAQSGDYYVTILTHEGAAKYQLKVTLR